MLETQGGTRNRTRDLPKKGSAFVTSSDDWTGMWRVKTRCRMQLQGLGDVTDARALQAQESVVDKPEGVTRSSAEPCMSCGR